MLFFELMQLVLDCYGPVRKYSLWVGVCVWPVQVVLAGHTDPKFLILALRPV